MANCPLCGTRKGRRACPAKGALICPQCCGSKRLVLIDCPQDCVFLDGGAAGWARETTMRRDAARLHEMIDGLTEAQIRLLFVGLVGVVAVRARHHGLDDARFGSALQALRKTVETRASGLVYEHPPEDPRATALVRDLAGLFEAEDPKGRRAVPADADLLAVLRGLEKGLTVGGDTSPHSFLDTVVRLVGRRGAPDPQADPSVGPLAPRPGDHRMSFGGELKTLPLPDILDWVARRMKTGRLDLKRKSTEKKLTFRDGLLHSSFSNDPRETIGQALVRERLIKEEQLFTALLRQEKEGKRLGQILIGDGLLTEEALKRTLRQNAEHIVYDLFLWPDGRFDFHEEDIPADLRISLDIEIPYVLEEGRHRRLEWERLKQKFKSSDITFTVKKDGEEVGDPAAQAILKLAAAGKTLAGIALESRRSEFETALMLEGLMSLGAVSPAQPTGPGDGSDPVGAIQALLQQAERRTKEGRFNAALEAYEAVLSLDFLNHEAKKGLVAVGEARKRERVARQVPLDKVPRLLIGQVALTHEAFDSQEGFVLSRINGQWDVRSILKLCPMPEIDALVDLRPPARPQGHRAAVAGRAPGAPRKALTARDPRTRLLVPIHERWEQSWSSRRSIRTC